MKTQVYNSPVGELILGAFEDRLVLCDWRYRRMRKAIDKRLRQALDAEYEVVKEHTVINQTIHQLEEYFQQSRQYFDLPMTWVGSDFQKDVWKALTQIGYGQTTSYRELARSINHENAIRAVASANGANALSIIVPCHRVIGSDGSLTGYAGGLTVKKRLLRLENSNSISNQLELFD